MKRSKLIDPSVIGTGLLLAGLVFCVPSAKAALAGLTYGGPAVTFSATVGNATGNGFGGGTIVPGGTLISPFSFPYTGRTGPAADTGVLDSFVVKGDSYNTLGGLTFVYKLTMAAVSGTLTQVGINDPYWPNSVLVGYGTAGGTPTEATDPSGADTINFYGSFAAGQTYYFLVGTPDNYFIPGTATVQDGTIGKVNVLVPIPEPTTALAGTLMMVPFGLSVFRRFRKQQSA
jgi:hypothetical protein